MAKKRGSGQSKAPNRPPMASHRSVSLRAEVSGLKPTAKGGGNVNPKSMLKLEHLQKLAVWGGGEGSVPSLGAFFGRRLAAVSESLAVPPDPSLLYCQRCETILQPGFNCTTRIEKNITKPRRRRGKQPNTAHKNNMVYTCSFCSHKNLKRGTPKSHIKDINPKPKSKQPKPEKKSLLQIHTDPGTGTETDVVAEKMEVNDSAAMEEEVMPLESPATPMVRTLLDMKKRKRNKSASKKPMEPESPSVKGNSEVSSGASSKKRRKSWMSLKEIAEGNEQSRNIGNLKIPFFG